MNIIYTTWVVFLAVIFSVGFLSGISRSIVNGAFEGWPRTLAWGCLMGFCSVAVVGYIAEDPTVDHVPLGYYIGVAAAVGVLGKQSIDWLRKYANRFSPPDADKTDDH